MANYVNFRTQYEKIIKNYGVTTLTEEELFKDKYDKKFIYSATLWADVECEFIGSINDVVSTIRVLPDQAVVLDNFVPWDSLKIKAPIGTTYDILMGM